MIGRPRATSLRSSVLVIRRVDCGDAAALLRRLWSGEFCDSYVGLGSGVPARGSMKLPLAGHPRRGRLASPTWSPPYGRFRGTAAGRLDGQRRAGFGEGCPSAAKPERQHPVEAVCKRVLVNADANLWCFGAAQRIAAIASRATGTSPYALISAISVLAPTILIARCRL